MIGKSGGEISRKNKGVLDRPWTKWRVLMVMSSTLKFQFTVNPESQRFDYSVRQKIGDPGPSQSWAAWMAPAGNWFSWRRGENRSLGTC